MLRALLTAAALVALFLVALPAQAQAPDIGQKVTITLHDGNQIQGTLVNKSDTGYVVRLGGNEITVQYKDVASIVAGTPAPPPTAAPRTTVAPSGGVIVVPQSATTIVSNNRPPAPRIRGTGLMVAGWVIFGIGAIGGASIAYVCAVFGDCELDETPMQVGIGITGTLGVAGLAMGISGTVMRASSKRAYSDWEARYSKRETPKLEIIGITPIIREDEGGLAIVGRF